MNLKKLLAGTAAFLLMLPASSLAASIESAGGSVASDTDRTVTVSVKYNDAAENMQATLLVLPSSVNLATSSVGDIKYIKQTTAAGGASGTEAQFSFSLSELDRKGSYTAYVGGTGLDSPYSFTFNFNNTITITPTAPDTVNEITVLICDADGNAVAAEPTVENGKYSYSLEGGVYTLKISGQAILPYERSVDISSCGADLGGAYLISGDVNGDRSVTLADLEEVYGMWLAEGVNADVNGDGNVTLADLEIVYKNWLKTSEAYN